MSTEYYNSQWQMPNEANKSKQANYSMYFTQGSNRGVNLGDALNFFIGSFSASMWVKSPDNGKEFFSRYISANGVGNFRIGCGANAGTANAVTLITKASLLSGSTNIRDGNWHHVCVTMDAISSSQYTRTIYVDGSQDAQDTIGLTTYVSTSSSYGLNLGCNFQNNGHNTVDMSEVSIFDYALSTSQVTTLYGSSSTGVGDPMSLSPAPQAYYKLSDSVWDGSKYITANNAAQDYVFDFSSNYIETNGVGDILGNGCTNFTTALWFNHNFSGGSTVGIFEFDTSASGTTPKLAVRCTSDIRIEINYAGTQTKRYATPGQGIWTHLIIAFDGTNTVVYIDGQPASPTNVYNPEPASIDFNGTSVAIGLYNTINNLYKYDGKISNFQVFNSTLSSTEAETLYNYGSPIRTLANIPQNSNLKAWYKLDASEIYNSSITDWEINEATADYTSSTRSTSVTGSGTQVPNIQTWGPTSALTFSTWFKTSEGSSSGDPNYFKNLLSAPMDGSLNPGFYIVFYNNSVFSMLRTGGTNNNLSASVVVNDGKWHHVARTWDGSVSNLYIDGQNASTVDDPQTGSMDYGTTSGNNNLGIGCLYNPTRAGASSTDVSNVSVWSSGLSASEITELYNNGQPGNLSSHSATSNLTGWWTLKDASAAAGGGLVDLSSNSNNANTANTDVVPGSVSTLNGESSGMSQANLVQSDLQTVAPYSKYAMNFDGTDGITISVGSLTLTSYSMSIWINVDSLPSLDWRRIFEFGNRRFFGLQSDGKLSLGYPSWTENETVATISTNKWYHLVFADNGTNTVVYINGVGETISNTSNATGSTWWIANVNSGTGLDAKLSNCSVWNTALTASQVREIYNEGLPSNLNSHSAYSNLISWWKLGEGVSYDGTSLIVQDYKGNNHGTSNSSMDQTDIVNGVGTSSNGASAGFTAPSTTVTNIVSDAPYSDKNAVSVNMQSAKSGSGINTSTPQAT